MFHSWTAVQWRNQPWAFLVSGTPETLLLVPASIYQHSWALGMRCHRLFSCWLWPIAGWLAVGSLAQIGLIDQRAATAKQQNLACLGFDHPERGRELAVATGSPNCQSRSPNCQSGQGELQEPHPILVGKSWWRQQTGVRTQGSEEEELEGNSVVLSSSVP